MQEFQIDQSNQENVLNDLRDAMLHMYRLQAFINSIVILSDSDSDLREDLRRTIGNDIHLLASEGLDKCSLIVDALGKVIDDIGASQPAPSQ